MQIQKLKDDLITGGFFLAILLPMRLFFYTYLSHYWLGAFGVVSGITITIYYLSSRNKLGVLGQTLMRTISRRTKGKTFKVALAGSIFVIYLASLAVASNQYADPTVYNQLQVQLKDKGISNMTSLQKYEQAHPPTFSLPQFGIAMLALITPNDISFSVWKTANELTSGLLLSFFTIIIVEEIEFLGILFYLKYSTKNKLII